jgi:hypothetical protein
MTLLDEVKTNGRAEPATRAWDARLARIERRLAALPAEIVETGEQRVAILRDAIADFAAAELAKRDEEIVSLKKQLADLQQKLEQQAAIDQRVHEISARLEEKQARRDRGKNGITDGDIIQTMDMVIAQERQSARKEFKAADEEMQRALEAKLAAVEERLKAVPGKLPVAKDFWCPESVTYQAEFVCHEGALYQARKDTAQAPGGSDWVCVARAGHDGCDGQTPNFRGRHDAYQKYQQFDVIEFDGSSFIALYDTPGIPGDPGWQILSKNGSRGPVGDTGPRGRRGARGEAAPTIISWTLDCKNYRAIPTMSNGTQGAVLELRGLFEQFVLETSYMVEANTGA